MATRRTARKTARHRRSPATNQIAGKLTYRPLRFEPLEDRRVLAAITVTTLSDSTDLNDGLTSLREAIFAANLVAGAETINFAPSLTANGPATILLTEGELKITDALTIVGPGKDLLTIDAKGNDPAPTSRRGDGSRIFNIDDGTSTVIEVAISGFSMTGGDVMEAGGAIFTRETLSLANSTLDDNYAHSAGGGAIAATLRDGASFSMADCIVSNNVAAYGGGVSLDVAQSSFVEINRCEIFGNENRSGTSGRGGGLLISNNGGSVSIADSRIYHNSCRVSGGGLYVAGDITIERSSILNNSASQSGGGIYHISNQGQGRVLRLVDSEVVNNTAAAGGGLWLESSVNYAIDKNYDQIVRTVISANTAEGGFSDRGLGGGIFVRGAYLKIVDSTIDGNVAERLGGGLYSVSLRDILIESSVVSRNTAQFGGGLYLRSDYINDRITIQ